MTSHDITMESFCVKCSYVATSAVGQCTRTEQTEEHTLHARAYTDVASRTDRYTRACTHSQPGCGVVHKGKIVQVEGAAVDHTQRLATTANARAPEPADVWRRTVAVRSCRGLGRNQQDSEEKGRLRSLCTGRHLLLASLLRPPEVINAGKFRTLSTY